MQWIKATWRKLTSLLGGAKAGEQSDSVLCLVGNIIKERQVGVEKVSKQGTNQFAPGTKVYCYPSQWGDGYERIKVIGQHRKAKKKIIAVVAAKYITNWRVKRVYDPFVVSVMKNDGADRSGPEKERILRDWAEHLNNKNN